MKTLETNEIKAVSGGFDPIVGLSILSGTTFLWAVYNSRRIASIERELAHTVPVVDLPLVY